MTSLTGKGVLRKGLACNQSQHALKGRFANAHVTQHTGKDYTQHSN